MDDLESLPVEINCQILARLTDPGDISNLLSTNAYLGSIAKDCITTLEWRDGDRKIPASFVSRFSNIIRGLSPVYVDNLTDFFRLADLPKLREITIEFPAAFSRSNRSKTEFSIDTIEAWYQSKTPISGKNITFQAGNFT